LVKAQTVFLPFTSLRSYTFSFSRLPLHSAPTKDQRLRALCGLSCWTE